MRMGAAARECGGENWGAVFPICCPRGEVGGWAEKGSVVRDTVLPTLLGAAQGTVL